MLNILIFLLNFLHKVTALNGALAEEVSCLAELIKAGDFIVLFVGQTEFLAGSLYNVHYPGSVQCHYSINHNSFI